ncbi:MASE3 domain-containing protein [Ferribacterium limneticum]|uniref:MASE3 domain-containing protein n=1 Tax=Ferribacterium limneticum TaxID=76259 RepID=UPI001CF866C6|nr:MASE3 domain-containing protein [Ferribacterium limneticum]UCV22022.1 response regulator [Ferribacterium limneticum]
MQIQPLASGTPIKQIDDVIVKGWLVGYSPEVFWAAGLTLILVFGQMLPAAKLFDSPSNYLPLHTLLEFIAMAVSAMVFALAWNLRNQGINSHRVILGAGFLAVALVDFAHALSYAGMPALLTPSSPEKAINFWLAGRYIAAGVLLAVAVLPPRQWPSTTSNAVIGSALALAATIWWVGLGHAEWLPRTFIEGQGLTAFKIGFEYLLAAVYGMAAIRFYVISRHTDNKDLRWLAAAAWIQGLAEMFFTIYADVTDVFNLLGHVYKAIAYVMIYRALFVAGVQAPYRELDIERSRLRQSERDLRSILDNLPSMIGYWDATLHNRFANHAYATWFGINPEQIPGKHIRDVIGEERFRLNLPYIEAALRGEPQIFERDIPAPDGSVVRHSQAHYIPDAQDGEVRGFYVLVSDITPLKLAQAELENHRKHLEGLVKKRTADLERAREAAEASNVAKSTFLANMSHELRTPMNAVIGMTALALRHARDPKLIDQLTKVTNASHHLLRVINDILDISKIEADHLTLEKRSFKLGEVLENLLSLVSHRFQEKGIKLQVDLPAEVAHLSMKGDPLRLGQILLNLTGNALKFTTHGSVTIRIRVAEESPDDLMLRFEIQDTGIGISAENQKRIFNAFEQADGSMTRKYGGTGLGLAISKRLVHLMAGDIGVESVPGSGSTFWFTARMDNSTEVVMPVQAKNIHSAEDRLRIEHANTRILLAEDEPINQEVARELLEDVGLVVDLAEDGKKAVELAKQNRYALILMDMQMPNLNGVDATREIRALPGYQGTPILAITANAFDEDRRGCLNAGMNDHIGKPVDPEQLFEILLKWLPRSQA